MQAQSPSGRPLPGWGFSLRRWQTRTGRTALMIAAVASFAMSGCTGTHLPSATTGTTASVQSEPARLRGALTLAMLHLDSLSNTASKPFSLVAFKGQGLDAEGTTVPASGSHWEFTFSRYAEGGPSTRYQIASVLVPGTGPTRLTVTESEDVALSPIERWDNALTDTLTPDSQEFLKPLKEAGVPTAGATITLRRGEVLVTAGGKSTTYDTQEGTFSPVQ